MLLEQIADVRALLQKRDWDSIQDTIVNLPEADIAELLLELDTPDRVLLFRMLPRDISSDVFSFFSNEQQNRFLDELTLEETRHILSELSPDDRANLLHELPGEVTQKLLNLLSPADLKETRQLLGYPPESVGRLMTPDYVAVRPDWTIAHALKHLREKGHDRETINVLYVVDQSWRLLDALGLRSFILANPDAKVSDIMDNQYLALKANEDREEAVRMMERYDLAFLPVVDTQGILVGIVTFDDVFDVARAEVTEDFHKGAAVTPIRGPYREAGFGQLYSKRIGWLLALVFANVFSGAAIANFEDTIAANVALVFFLPLLIDSSGNAGSQAATLMVRALAMGDVKLKDWWWLLGKELFVSIALGLTMAVAVSLIGVLRAGTEIAIIVSLTMTLVVVIGSIIGTALPFVLSRFNFDPATASAPLITSLSDISGVLIYFTIATIFLSNIG